MTKSEGLAMTGDKGARNDNHNTSVRPEPVEGTPLNPPESVDALMIRCTVRLLTPKLLASSATLLPARLRCRSSSLSRNLVAARLLPDCSS